MGRLIRSTVLVVWVWLLLAGTCFARQVYLKDGGIVEAQSVRRQGGLVVVQVNRDTVVEFERSEVDLARTFRPAGKKKHPASQKKSSVSQRSLPAVKATPADAGTASAPGAALPAASAAAKPAPAAAKQAAAPSARPAGSNAPAVQPAPGPVVQPQPVPAPAPAPVAAPPAKVEAPPEPATRPSAEPAPSMTKEELEKVRKEAAEMMAEAIRKKDPEMMKKAVELQKSTIPQGGAQQGAAVGAGMSTSFLLVILFVSLLIVASLWVVFEKGGQEGWKSLIPIYNLYILMLVCEKPGWWFILLFIPLVGTVFSLLAMLALAERFGRGPLFGVGLTFLPMIFLPLLAFGGSKPEEFTFA
jgi:hypothetical protein